MKEVMDGMDLDEVGKNIGEMCLHLWTFKTPTFT
jgi:hypothetical protein